MEAVTEPEVSPAEKQVQFVGLENVDSQSTSGRRITRPYQPACDPKLNKAEREVFREFVSSFKSRIAGFLFMEPDEFDISHEEEFSLEEIRNNHYTSPNDKKEAEIAFFWGNTAQTKLYHDIIEAIQRLETRNLKIKAVNKSMKLVANYRGCRDYLVHLPSRCWKLDPEGVEFMFWDAVCKYLRVRYYI
jgi:hypothetical protein